MQILVKSLEENPSSGMELPPKTKTKTGILIQLFN